MYLLRCSLIIGIETCCITNCHRWHSKANFMKIITVYWAVYLVTKTFMYVVCSIKHRVNSNKGQITVIICARTCVASANIMFLYLGIALHTVILLYDITHWIKLPYPTTNKVEYQIIASSKNVSRYKRSEYLRHEFLIVSYAIWIV